MPSKVDFQTELRVLIDKYSLDKESDTPDFVLVDYITRCLDAYNLTIQARDKWLKSPDGIVDASR